MEDRFSGDQKRLDHFLRGYETNLIRAFLPLVPPWMGTVHLTLLTFLWTALVVLSGYLAAGDIRWLWGFSACIFLQYLTDMLDGEVGRQRGEGLVKWGFYMDHLLDYVFSCAVMTGYSFLLPPSHFYLIVLWLVAGSGFLVHAFLDFGVTGEFKISFNRFGVSEIRHALILLNVILVLFGKEVFVWIIPFLVAAFWIVLAVMVCQSQANYRAMDRRNREGKD
ncbi:MAG: CDP-alcohol phosphatidyltransferase family protein [Candidatus Omnitrophica bacterium]|nr:CDP-alcohol phosphatidyltransferase family protein [Candidatus Omnitrophota bacterium]